MFLMLLRYILLSFFFPDVGDFTFSVFYHDKKCLVFINLYQISEKTVFFPFILYQMIVSYVIRFSF